MSIRILAQVTIYFSAIVQRCKTFVVYSVNTFSYDLVDLSSSHSGLFCPLGGHPVLVKFSNPALNERAEKSRRIWLLQVGEKTHMEQARDSLLEGFQAVEKDLLLHNEIKHHFPEKKRKR